MSVCNACPSNPNCENCKQFIDGGTLRKKVNPPRAVILEDKENKKNYNGLLYVISRVGMLIKTTAPRQSYIVDINDEITAKISPVMKKDLIDTDFISFDIVKVSRKTSQDERLSRDEYEYLFSDKKDLIDQLTEDLDENIKNEVREKLKIDLLKSELLDQLQLSATYKYEKGRLKQVSGDKDSFIKESDMLLWMNEALKQNAPRRETLIDPDKERYIDVHSVPLGYQSGGFVTLDVTNIVQKEKQLLEEQWQSFREVTHALSKGKVHLIKYDEIVEILSNCELISEMEVSSSTQLKEVREMIKQALVDVNLQLKNQYQLLLSVQEGLTNALKHVGSGKIKIYIHEVKILIMIEDHGKGMLLKDIPKATLIKGYSTSATLGQGFHLMTSYCSQLFLKTDTNGTTLILEYLIGDSK